MDLIPPEENRISYVFKFLQTMSENELRLNLERSGLEPSGSRKQMIKRLRDQQRASLIAHRKANAQNYRTENLYDYFIVMDFECTCEEGKYDYDHEIIEFPAVLVSVRQRKIIDSFRTIIRPKCNSKLTSFCTKLTGITQEQIDSASTFPDALDMFRGWMSKHGLDGLHNSGGCRRFCYVTDGPWDIANFFQSDCLKWNISVPHDFRCFLNIRRAFINFYCHARPKNPKPARLPNVDLRAMLDNLGLEFEGNEHCGLDDAGNIARILLRMMEDRAELRVNEKLVDGKYLQEWQKLVFDGCNGEPDEIDEGAKLRWWDKLPYKLVKISRDQFLGEQFMECESCDEVI